MNDILKIKISIRGIKPKIWREVLVKKNSTFKKLHEVIQLSFEWTNSHLYDFKVGDHRFSEPDEDYFSDDLDVKLKISEYLNKKGQKAIYTYDFGDDWEHEVLVTGVLNSEKSEQYPKCVGGARNCPPEDCGGVFGYARILEALKSDDKEEYEEIREWLGGDYDPELFDSEEVNETLKNPDEYLLDFSDYN